MTAMNMTFETCLPDAPAATLSDLDLVSAARLGDNNAFAELCQRHSRNLMKRLTRITRNREDAEDALQDSFLRAFLHLGSFQGKSQFSTWLSQIAHNSALMILRKRRRGPQVSLDETGPDGTLEIQPVWVAPSAEAQCIGGESLAALNEAAERLRPRLLSVLRLRVVHEYPIEQIAAMNGISVAATKTRLHRAKAELARTIRRRRGNDRERPRTFNSRYSTAA